MNDKAVKPNHRIHPNDVISIVLPDPVREIEIIPENIPINILYEDDDILVVLAGNFNRGAGSSYIEVGSVEYLKERVSID